MEMTLNVDQTFSSQFDDNLPEVSSGFPASKESKSLEAASFSTTDTIPSMDDTRKPDAPEAVLPRDLLTPHYLRFGGFCDSSGEESDGEHDRAESDAKKRWKKVQKFVRARRTHSKTMYEDDKPVENASAAA
jgi:hypothetical protein